MNMLLKAVGAAAIAARCGNSGKAASGGTGTARNGEAAWAAAISGPGEVQSGSDVGGAAAIAENKANSESYRKWEESIAESDREREERCCDYEIARRERERRESIAEIVREKRDVGRRLYTHFISHAHNLLGFG